MQILGIAQKRLAQIAHVAGKHQGLGLSILGYAHLDGSGTQQMSHIHHANADAGADLHPLPIMAGHKQLMRFKRMLLGIKRLLKRPAAALRLAVFPLGVHLLDMRGIQQHNFTQVGGGVRGENFAPEAVFIKQRQIPAVVDVRMGQENIVDFGFRDGQRGVLIEVDALLHAVVHHNVFFTGVEQKAAARYLARRAQKGELH